MLVLNEVCNKTALGDVIQNIVGVTALKCNCCLAVQKGLVLELLMNFSPEFKSLRREEQGHRSYCNIVVCVDVSVNLKILKQSTWIPSQQHKGLGLTGP